MSKKLLSVIVLTTLLGFLNLAPAEETAPASKLSGAGFFLGQIGAGGMQTYQPPAGVYTDYSNREGMSVHVEGGYLFRVAPKFEIGPELGYSQYPQNSLGSDTLKITYTGHYIELGARAKFKYGTNWSLQGKLGFAAMTQRTEFASYYQAIGLPASKTDTTTAPLVNIGFGYDFTPNFGLTFGATGVYANDLTNDEVVYPTKVASVYLFTIGLAGYFS